ncbi:MAG: hypothetical protein JSU70_05270 [Phycisphaerales bacterium]|nr:MAG: hypothetical protein JSU70_05270 [Phycisphaerales bacterium]
MEVQGYPQIVILVVLAVGFVLALLRPYAAFLFTILLLTAGNADVFNQTRTTALGPYLNLSDVCVLVALAGLFLDKLHRKEPVWAPRIVPLILAVLTIGACQSFWKLGWTYETARAYRWGVQWPLVYLLGANLVTTPKRAKQLVGTLLCGAILAASQHVFLVAGVWRAQSLDMQTYEFIRTISYWAGGIGAAFLISAAVWKMPRGAWKKGFYIVTGLLLLGSIFLSQTRSIWVAVVCSLPCLLVLLKGRRRLANVMKFGFIVVLMLLAMAWVCQRVMPGLDIYDIAAGRIEALFDRGTQSAHMGTRERAFNAEMGSWMDGTLIFGRGLRFFQTVRNSEHYARRIAFNHLGYVTYLSQLGMIGLFVYGFLLPLGVLRDGLYLWNHAGVSILRYVGVLGTASIVLLSIMFLISSHFLALGYEAPAALYGSMWALARSERDMLGETCATE